MLSVPRWLIVAAIVALAALSFAMRLRSAHPVFREGGAIRIHDPDTQRRLVRVRNLVDPDKPYPYRNPHDGPPDGTVIHWTLPLDFAYVLLDPFVRGWYPEARPFEAAALWLGPVLGTIGSVVFALLAIALFGPARGLAAALLYTLSVDAIAATAFGIGDHQSLQDVTSIVAALGFALCVGRPSRWAAITTGLGAGAALWTTAESTGLMLVLLLAAGLSLAGNDDALFRRRVRSHAMWVLVTIGVAAVATQFEQHRGPLSFQWDKVSGFQLYQLAVFALFLAVAARLRGRWHPVVTVAAAAASAIGVGLLGIFAFLSNPFAEQMESFRSADLWTSQCVNEYRPLFVLGGTFYTALATNQLTVLFWGAPLFVAGLWLARDVPSRFAILALAAGTFALAIRSSKLLHLFVIAWPILIAVGGWRLLELARVPRLRGVTGTLAIVTASAVCWWYAPKALDEVPGWLRVEDELVAWLQQLPRDEPGSILAPWQQGGQIMNQAERGAVATNYHRNIEGIRDSFRFIVAQSWDDALPILERRDVRWILVLDDPTLRTFWQADKVLETPDRHIYVYGKSDVIVADGEIVERPKWRPDQQRINSTIWSQLVVGQAPAEHVTQVWQSKAGRTIVGRDGQRRLIPQYRVYEVQ